MVGPIGMWHVHPRARRSASVEDLRLFSRLRTVFNIEKFAALVVVPDGSNWDLEAVVVEAAHSRDVACRAVVR
jgi:hypothetical protein